MLTYKAMYKFLDQGVHAEVLDIPGTITFGATLEEARRLLASALVDMAETNLLRGESSPFRVYAAFHSTRKPDLRGSRSSARGSPARTVSPAL